MKRGFTLIEVIVALAIFASAFVLIISALPELRHSQARSRTRAELRTRMIEALRQRVIDPAYSPDDLPAGTTFTEEPMTDESVADLGMRKLKITVPAEAGEGETLEIVVPEKNY